MNTKHTSEKQAREDARKCNEHYVQIVESRGIYYVESNEDITMIRSWEKLIFLGDGKDA